MGGSVNKTNMSTKISISRKIKTKNENDDSADLESMDLDTNASATTYICFVMVQMWIISSHQQD